MTFFHANSTGKASVGHSKFSWAYAPWSHTQMFVTVSHSTLTVDLDENYQYDTLVIQLVRPSRNKLETTSKKYFENLLMARRISPEMYPRLLDYLKEDLPKSGMIYFALKLVMKGLMKKKTVWVDSGPGLSCVVVSEEKRQIDCVCRAIIYCKGPGFVRSLDSALKCVSDYLSQKLVLIGCIEEVADALLELIKKEEETSITSLSVIWATTTIVYSFEKKYHLVNMNVPPGITVRCLTSNETEIVCNSWKHRELYADLKERIEEEINTLDSICLFNRKGEPIAWALQKQYGCIGMVHVIPEYRRLGLGSLVISRLVEKILKTEDITYSCVEYQNKASMALHEKVGFRINPRLPKCVFIHVVHDNKK